MKFSRITWMVLVVLLSTYANVYASKGIAATEEDSARLRQDLRAGHLKVGISRIKDFVDSYGEPNKKADGERKISLEYGDLKIEFDRRRYWRKWEYDSSKQPAYTDKINLLRKKLESQKITGKNILTDKFIKDYDEPTEIDLKADDGEHSIYYYGNIKLTFENVYTLRNWEAKKLNDMAGAALTTEKAVPSNNNLSSTLSTPSTATPVAPVAK